MTTRQRQIEKSVVEVYFELLVDRPEGKAIKVTDGVNALWLPKSQITYEKIKGNDVVVVMPHWLAKDKGII